MNRSSMKAAMLMATMAGAAVDIDSDTLRLSVETGPADFGARMQGKKYNAWRLKRLKRIRAAHGGTLPKKYRRK